MNPESTLFDVLTASGPHPACADKLRLFGQFVGSWDLEVCNYPPAGPARWIEGEWHFGWALEGRAIVDVWIAPRRDQRAASDSGPGEWGATLRFYDPAIDAWRSTWHGPVRGVVRPFLARPVGDEIVLEGSFEPGVDPRWVFSRISQAGFHWRAVQSHDGWQTERRLQEMVASRAVVGRGPAPWSWRSESATGVLRGRT
jgi:hypothetical protein